MLMALSFVRVRTLVNVVSSVCCEVVPVEKAAAFNYFSVKIGGFAIMIVLNDSVSCLERSRL